MFIDYPIVLTSGMSVLNSLAKSVLIVLCLQAYENWGLKHLTPRKLNIVPLKRKVEELLFQCNRISSSEKTMKSIVSNE